MANGIHENMGLLHHGCLETLHNGGMFGLMPRALEKANPDAEESSRPPGASNNALSYSLSPFARQQCPKPQPWFPERTSAPRGHRALIEKEYLGRVAITVSPNSGTC